MASVHTFVDGKLMFKDKIAYANGDYVSLKDYEELENKVKRLKYELDKTYNQLMETEKSSQEKISELESKLIKAQSEVQEWHDEAIAIRNNRDEMLANFRKGIEPYVDLQDMHDRIKELEFELEVKDNDSKRKDTEDYAKYNQITSGTYGLLFRKYKGKSRNDVILKFSEFINTLSENGIEVFDEAEGFVVEIKDDSLRSNDEIASLQKQIEKLESIRTRCHKSAMDSFDLGMYEFLHIVTADELKTTKDVNDRTVELPFDALETANMLINATYKWENCMTGKIYDKDIYDIDDLEQIAEHLLVYCKHHREDEE